jgi:hypothetical protein
MGRWVCVSVQEAINKEVLRRMTDDELRGYVGALRRMRDGKEPAEDDGPIFARVEELREEVRNEHTAAN